MGELDGGFERQLSLGSEPGVRWIEYWDDSGDLCEVKVLKARDEREGHGFRLAEWVEVQGEERERLLEVRMGQYKKSLAEYEGR
jgi:hypothetical protein